MLIDCSECGAKISDQAAACPSCGISRGVSSAPTEAPDIRKAPIFAVISFIGLFMVFSTPRLLLFFPVVLTLGAAVVSFFRKERWRGGAVAGAALCVVVLMMDSAEMAAPTTTNLEAAELVDWNWEPDPSFGTDGTIKWRVSVRNKSDKPIESVKVDFVSYDAGGKVLDSAFSYVSAIPPGETRTDESFADYYGTESTANATITEVRFSE